MSLDNDILPKNSFKSLLYNFFYFLRHGKSAPKPAPWAQAQDNGAWAKAALLSGPPGVGKTTTAYLVSKVSIIFWYFRYFYVHFRIMNTQTAKLLVLSYFTVAFHDQVRVKECPARTRNRINEKMQLYFLLCPWSVFLITCYPVECYSYGIRKPALLKTK